MQKIKLERKSMEIKDIKRVSESLYEDIELNGMV